MLKTTLLIGGAVIIALALGIGGTFVYMTRIGHGSASAATLQPKPSAPAPIYFAEVSDIVVSIPDTAGDPPSSFVQFGIQFQTTDADAVTDFNTLEPIIKSQIMELLMQQTGSTLQNAATRSDIETKSLALVNAALQTRDYVQKSPFSAAYITSLVVQD